jgi:hypothetical protein
MQSDTGTQSQTEVEREAGPAEGGTHRDRLRWMSPPVFGVILLCFLFPFITVSCEGEEATFTGVQLATGRGMDEVSPGLLEHVAIPDPFVIIALLFAAAGLVLGFVRGRRALLWASVAGALGAIALATEAPFQAFRLDSLEERLGYRLAVLVFLGAVALNDMILARAKHFARGDPERRALRVQAASTAASLAILGAVVAPLVLVGFPQESRGILVLVRSGVVVVLAAVGAVYAFVGSRETRAAQEGRLPARWGGPETERHVAAMISLLGGIIAVVLPLTAGTIGWLAVLAIPAAIGALIAGVRELRWAGRDPFFRAAAASGIGMAFLPMYVLLLGLLLYGFAR